MHHGKFLLKEAVIMVFLIFKKEHLMAKTIQAPEPLQEAMHSVSQKRNRI
jgi:hypothetical protein